MAEKSAYEASLFLPKTDFPMRAGLPEREPEFLARWERIDLYGRLREAASGRQKYVLHDGPPYANGNIHIGTGLNKILKDVVTRSMQMLGHDACYVPGWDCHGLPIEWMIEQEYRARGRSKDDVPIIEFRRECRQFAQRWIDVQREEFKRLGVLGDWQNPYTTMSFDAEAQIARELMKFAMSGTLYRGSKPVMWSVVEKTALAEAEVEYHDYTSDTVWAAFPVMRTGAPDLRNAALVIWTTTPWTIPGNRAIAYSERIAYSLYRVTATPADNWAKAGALYVLADSLAEEVMKAARVQTFDRVRPVSSSELSGIVCAHPLRERGYGFDVPLLAAPHVTEETGTGFVHTAPGHGIEDFDLWVASSQALKAGGIDPAIPHTVDADGVFTQAAPGFEGKRVLTESGGKGDANDAVIAALLQAGMLIARAKLAHRYPHSWRSKKPVIFRNTPQWFISMEDDKGAVGLRAKALAAIDATRFIPVSGYNRLRGMVADRPDWVISRQRAWGVPITVFIHRETGEIIPRRGFAGAGELIARIADAFEADGADVWFTDGARERFLNGLVDDSEMWEKVDDILDVWFDSGSTHAFVLEKRPELKWPATLYLEGSDQHRGWFHSSLLESCGTRGRAPYEEVLTHGFVMDEAGRKMSKSLGNVVTPQQVIAQHGAEILRLWVVTSDFTEDLRIGPEIIRANVDSYRKLRNTVRWLLGNLHHFRATDAVEFASMPELERYMLHRLAELDDSVRRDYGAYDFKRIFHALFNFAVVDLSAFYFDIRKDALYCDPASSARRKACLTVLEATFSHLTAWLAPILPFTMEEAWQERFPTEDSVHERLFPEVPVAWLDEALAAKWTLIRRVRRVVTGALEVERAAKRIGSSLEADPLVYVSDRALRSAIAEVDLAEIAITSAATVTEGAGPPGAFRLDDVPGVAVETRLAQGRKCARSWKVMPTVGSDPDYPDVTPRDAQALREWHARAG